MQLRFRMAHECREGPAGANPRGLLSRPQPGGGPAKTGLFLLSNEQICLFPLESSILLDDCSGNPEFPSLPLAVQARAAERPQGQTVKQVSKD